VEAEVRNDDRELVLVARAIARIRVGIVAIVSAVMAGFGLFAATLWLVIKGGPNVGQNLSLLRAYFPGYTVTWTGSVVGLLYGALTGAVVGWSVAWLYNLLAGWRSGRR
jgi:hypothetical protein